MDNIDWELFVKHFVDLNNNRKIVEKVIELKMPYTFDITNNGLILNNSKFIPLPQQLQLPEFAKWDKEGIIDEDDKYVYYKDKVWSKMFQGYMKTYYEKRKDRYYVRLTECQDPITKVYKTRKYILE
tara:strand:+ start:4739 stop:5119 length:381 start_codon:yes stop_codon:yes gene_type:complete